MSNLAEKNQSEENEEPDCMVKLKEIIDQYRQLNKLYDQCIARIKINNIEKNSKV